MLCHGRYWGNWVKNSLAMKLLIDAMSQTVDIEVIQLGIVW